MGECCGLAPVGHLEPGEDVGDVHAGGRLGDVDPFPDHPVGQPLRDEFEDLPLAAGQPEFTVTDGGYARQPNACPACQRFECLEEWSCTDFGCALVGFPERLGGLVTPVLQRRMSGASVGTAVRVRAAEARWELSAVVAVNAVMHRSGWAGQGIDVSGRQDTLSP